MEEVEGEVLAAWRFLIEEQKEVTTPHHRGAKLLEHLVGECETIKLDEETKHESMGLVSAADLCAWLFSEPSPHACLSFLDHFAAEDALFGLDEEEFPHHPPLASKWSDEEMESQGPFRLSELDEERNRLLRTKWEIFQATASRRVIGHVCPQVDVSGMIRRLRQARAISARHSFATLVADILLEHLDHMLNDAQARPLFQALLMSSDTQMVLEILRLVNMQPWIWAEQIVHLLKHPEERVRMAVIPLVQHIVKHGAIESADIVEAFSHLCQDPCSPVRTRTYKYLRLVVPPDIGLELAVRGAHDEEPVVAMAATYCIKELLVFRFDEDLEKYLPQLLYILPNNITWSLEAKSLLKLASEHIASNLSQYELVLEQLPLELQTLISNQSWNRKDACMALSLKMTTASCVRTLCESSSTWCRQLQMIINDRLSDRNHWRIRESGLHLLAILADESPHSVVSSQIHSVVEALSHPEAKVRARSYCAMGKILAAKIIEDERNSSDHLAILVDLITQEKHPSALEEVFHAITESMSNNFLEEMPFARVAQKIIDQCSHHEVTNRAAPLVLNLVGSWFARVLSSDLAAYAIPRAMSLLERIQAKRLLNDSDFSDTKCLIKIIRGEGAKHFGPYVERATRFVKKHLTPDVNINSISRQVRLLASLEILRLLMARGHDFLSTGIITLGEVMHVIVSIKSHGIAQDCLSQVVLFVSAVASSHPERIREAPMETQLAIFDFISSVLAEPHAGETLFISALTAMRELVVHLEDLIIPEWVTSCTVAVLSRSWPARPEVTRALSYVGRRFASAIASTAAVRILETALLPARTPFSACQLNCDLLGYLRIMQHVLSSSPQLLNPTGIIRRILHLLIICTDQEDDLLARDETMRTAVTAMLESAFAVEALDVLKPHCWMAGLKWYSPEVKERLLSVMEMLLSADHPLLQFFRTFGI